MRGREFITLLGSAAAVWPLAAHAQQATKLPTIGFLGSSTLSAMSQWTAAFVQRLRELGWIEGRTIAIEYRWAEGRTERAAAAPASSVMNWRRLMSDMGACFPPLCANETTQGITERTAGPWATPEMF